MSLRVTLRFGDPAEFENGVYLCAPSEGHMSVVIGKLIGPDKKELFEPIAFFPTILILRADVIPAPALALAPPLPFVESL